MTRPGSNTTPPGSSPRASTASRAGGLDGQVAVITGAASGIGLGIARTFARAGARLAILDLDHAQALATAKELTSQGGQALGLGVDVVDEAQVDASMAKVVETFGRLDVLVNNAGIQVVAPLEQFELADWKRVLAVHLDGAFLCTRAALKWMYPQRHGSIVYMGSVHSHEASVLKAPYVTAKHGLMGLAKVVAKEGAKHGVRANVVCPGFVRTPLVVKQIPGQAQALGISEDAVVREVMLKETLDGEFTTVEEVAEAVLFFASFESNAFTGQSLTVSHGWSMR
jgi:3-hydroxybutyrate dehydrogenase